MAAKKRVRTPESTLFATDAYHKRTYKMTDADMIEARKLLKLKRYEPPKPKTSWWAKTTARWKKSWASTKEKATYLFGDGKDLSKEEKKERDKKLDKIESVLKVVLVIIVILLIILCIKAFT